MAEISFSQSTEAEALNYQQNIHMILRKYRDLIQMDEKKRWKEMKTKRTKKKGDLQMKKKEMERVCARR